MTRFPQEKCSVHINKFMTLTRLGIICRDMRDWTTRNGVSVDSNPASKNGNLREQWLSQT